MASSISQKIETKIFNGPKKIVPVKSTLYKEDYKNKRNIFLVAAESFGQVVD